jgi:hypothetical protein
MKFELANCGSKLDAFLGVLCVLCVSSVRSVKASANDRQISNFLFTFSFRLDIPNANDPQTDKASVLAFRVRKIRPNAKRKQAI